MLTYRFCSSRGCSNQALAATAYCREHHPHPESVDRRIEHALRSMKTLVEGVDFSGLSFSGLDLSQREFRCCRFTGCTISDSNLKGIRLFLCFFDNVEFRSVTVSESRMMSVMAAGSRFQSVDFTGADIINTNFNGIVGEKLLFDESDLYSSRFISSSLTDVSFRDCNLKRVDFTAADLNGVDFTDSNPEEAYLERGETR